MIYNIVWKRLWLIDLTILKKQVLFNRVYYFYIVQKHIHNSIYTIILTHIFHLIHITVNIGLSR